MLLGWRGGSRRMFQIPLALQGSNLCQNAVVCHTPYRAILLALPDNWSCSQAKEEWKCYLQEINSQHITSLLSKVSNSKPYGQNRWWIKVPSDSTSFSVPKAFAQFTSSILTLIAVILPISQFDVSSRQTGKSGALERPQVAKLEVWVTYTVRQNRSGKIKEEKCNSQFGICDWFTQAERMVCSLAHKRAAGPWHWVTTQSSRLKLEMFLSGWRSFWVTCWNEERLPVSSKVSSSLWLKMLYKMFLFAPLAKEWVMVLPNQSITWSSPARVTLCSVSSWHGCKTVFSCFPSPKSPLPLVESCTWFLACLFW